MNQENRKIRKLSQLMVNSDSILFPVFLIKTLSPGFQINLSSLKR